MGIVDITSAEAFYRIIRTGICLVNFQAPWCAPCHAQEMILSDLTHRYEGRVRVCDVDTDALRDLSAAWAIAHVPTLILFRDGQEIQRLWGLQPAGILADMLEGALVPGGGPPPGMTVGPEGNY
jgi:thioredoxin 1